MIKFFRKIRENLLAEGKTGRYLKYAFGEILLVVIGILIALSINNWNEEKKQEKALDNIYEIVRSDLKNDIEEMRNFIQTYDKLKPYYAKVGDGTITKVDFADCDMCIFLFQGSLDLYLNKRGFNLLQDQQTATTDVLTLKILDFYTKQIIELDIASDIIVKELDNIFDVMSSKLWWSDFILKKEREEYENYLINDPEARNVVALFISSLYNLQYSGFQDFILEAEELVIELDTELMD